MKNKLVQLALVVLVTMAFSSWAQAQAYTCDDVNWNEAALEAIPNIANHCLEVVERGGGYYAKSRVRVVRQAVGGSTIVRFQNANGEWSNAERTYPPRGFTADISGEEVAIADLPAGQEVNVYVLQEEYFTLPEPVAEEAVAYEPAPAPEPEPEPAPVSLPKTASHLNWLAAIGMFFVLLSAGLYIRRQY